MHPLVKCRSNSAVLIHTIQFPTTDTFLITLIFLYRNGKDRHGLKRPSSY